jgi:O-antigen/teichoic acid export membrane protein
MRLSTHTWNIFYFFGGDIGSRVLGFLATVYLARVLGTSGFGIINIGMAVLAYALIISDVGLQFLGTRETAGNPDGLPSFGGQLFITRIILSVITFLIGAVILVAFLNSKEVKEVSLIYLLYIIPAALLLDWFFQGKKQIGVVATGKFFGMLFYLIFIFVFVHSISELSNVAWGWTLGIIVNVIILWFVFTQRKYRIQFGWQPKEFLQLFKSALPLGLATIIGQVIIQFPAIYLGLVSSTSEVGLFSAAFRVAVLLLIFDRAFYAIIYPIFSRTFQNEPGRMPTVFSNVLKLIVTLALFVGLLSVVGANFLINLLFGSAFENAVPIFQSMVGYFVITLIASAFGYTLVAMKMEKLYTKSLMGGMVVFFATIFWTVKLWGGAGAAISIVFYILTGFSMMAISLRRQIRMNFARMVVLPSLATLLIFLPALMLTNIAIGAKLLIATLLFLPAIGWLGGVGLNEIRYLKRALIWN